MLRAIDRSSTCAKQPLQIAVARFEPDAADERPLECRRVELPVEIARCSRCPGSPTMRMRAP